MIFYPNMIAHLITDIQAIDRQTGEIFTIRPKYSNTAAGVTVGQEIFTNPTNGTYASEEALVSMGTADGTVTSFTGVSDGPIRPNTVTILVAGNKVGADNGSGGIMGEGITGTVTYNSDTANAVTVEFTTAPVADAVIAFSAFRDTEKNPDLINKVEFEIAAKPITARAHPLKYSVSVQATLVARAHLGINVNDVLTEEVAGLIKQERDITLINRMTMAATHEAQLDFNASMTGINYPKRDKYSEISIKINYASKLINKRSNRGGASYVIAGINAASIIEQISGFVAEPTSVAPIGPYLMGTIKNGTIPVICVPNSTILGEDEYVVGFRGYQVGDSATIIAEWIPLYFTQLWESPDLINERGLLSMYDLFINRPEYLVKGSVTDFDV